VLLNLTRRHEQALQARGEPPPRKRAQDEKRAFTLLERQFRRELQLRWQEYLRGERTLNSLADWMRENLPRYQVEAYRLGQRARGDYSGQLTEADKKFLHAEFSHQMRYFHRFLRDVRAGRGRMDYAQRLDLYGKDLYGIFMTAYWGGLPYTVGRRFYWMLGRDAKGRPIEHCPDCIERAWRSRQQGGFTYEELVKMGLPGTGKTRCLNNCRCWIKEVGTRRFYATGQKEPLSARSSPPRQVPHRHELLVGGGQR